MSHTPYSRRIWILLSLWCLALLQYGKMMFRSIFQMMISGTEMLKLHSKNRFEHPNASLVSWIQYSDVTGICMSPVQFCPCPRDAWSPLNMLAQHSLGSDATKRLGILIISNPVPSNCVPCLVYLKGSLEAIKLLFFFSSRKMKWNFHLIRSLVYNHLRYRYKSHSKNRFHCLFIMKLLSQTSLEASVGGKGPDPT